MPDYSINQIALNENNTAYIATKESGLAKYSGNLQWKFYNENNSNIAENNLTCVAIDSYKNIWLGTAQQGLMLLDETITSLTNFDDDSGIRVYPNPAKDFILLYSNALIQHTYIYSIEGKLLEESNHVPAQSTSINTSALNQGIYFLEIRTTDGNSLIQKIIKL